MKKEYSKIPFDYITVKTTKSRIEKGLLAIPVSLIDMFPINSKKIYLINENGEEETKIFTPYNSSSRECRIGGLKDFYQKNQINDGDELVIQLLDDGKYKLISENVFKKHVLNFEEKFETSDNKIEADRQIEIIKRITNSSKEYILRSEFVRLANKEILERKIDEIQQVKSREKVPISLRIILLNLYHGKCQISGFTFTMKNGKPYFDIHHIDPLKGNHLKNLLVVSPNVHAQFTFANSEHYFDDEGWLRKVKFNEDTFSVFQINDDLPKFFEKEIHY
ncbi:MAG: hypothetical protein Q7J15_05535 [Candidatus Desulfaltia sp.]|nr:hypothetical protein [Candidatus Desulfaltia sp.]